MYEEIKVIIKDKLSAGFKKEEIINELHEAGYPPDLALEIYQQSYSEVISPLTTLPPLEDTVSATAVEQVNDNESNLQKSSNAKNEINLLKVVKILAGAVITVAIAYFTFLIYFQSAPYKNEGEMLLGSIISLQNKIVYSSEFSFEAVIEPRTNPTLLLSGIFNETEMNTIFNHIPVPEQGHVKYKLSSLVDNRNDKHIPDADFNLSLDVFVEPGAFSVDMDVRAVEDNIYARLNHLPVFLSTLLPVDELPMKQWVLVLENASDILDKIESLRPQSNFKLLNFVPDDTQNKSFSQMKKIFEIGKSLSLVENNGVALLQQIASVNIFLDEKKMSQKDLTEEEKKLVRQTSSIFIDYPMLKFVGKPKKLDVAGERLYQYEVNFHRDNIIKSLEELAKLFSNNSTELDEFTKMIVEDLPSQEEFDYINNLFTTQFLIGGAGDFRGMLMTSLFTFDEDAVNQIRLTIELSVGKEDESINITIPSEVYEKTFEEIMNEMFFRSSNSSQAILIQNSTVKQTMIRFRGDAEISYHRPRNNFTYTKVCDDLLIFPTNNYYSCNSDVDRYVVYAKLEPELDPSVSSEYDLIPKFFCIDSTGIALEMMTEPDLQKLSCRNGDSRNGGSHDFRLNILEIQE